MNHEWNDSFYELSFICSPRFINEVEQARKRAADLKAQQDLQEQQQQQRSTSTSALSGGSIPFWASARYSPPKTSHIGKNLQP
jgi:hypothetical protein